METVGNKKTLARAQSPLMNKKSRPANKFEFSQINSTADTLSKNSQASIHPDYLGNETSVQETKIDLNDFYDGALQLRRGDLDHIVDDVSDEEGVEDEDEDEQPPVLMPIAGDVFMPFAGERAMKSLQQHNKHFVQNVNSYVASICKRLVDRENEMSAAADMETNVMPDVDDDTNDSVPTLVDEHQYHEFSENETQCESEYFDDM